MHCPSPQFILGFHGCSKETAEKVFSGKEPLRASANSHDWLGHGIYFWEGAPARAMQWAKSSKSAKRNPYVVGAIINLGCCLNLTDTAHQLLLQRTYDHIKDAEELTGVKLPVNKNGRNQLDCVVINQALVFSEMESKITFDTVRGVFPEGDPIYSGSCLLTKTHIQIAVRNPACILGYFRPLEIGSLLKDSTF